MRAAMPLAADETRTLRLPPVIRWALGLNEGDLLAAESPEGTGVRFWSYGERARRASEDCGDPWPYVEELLRLPMTALDPGGTLRLPDAIAARLGALSGGTLFLRAWVERGQRGLSLERREGRQPAPELWAEARYSLEVEPDCRVLLPADALWALSGTREPTPPETLRLEALLIPSTRVVLIVTLQGEDASFRMEPCLEF
jgi:hypothetical protein